MNTSLKERSIDHISRTMGISVPEATTEFQGMVNWYLRGTGHTFSDLQYAIECAAFDVLEDNG